MEALFILELFTEYTIHSSTIHLKHRHLAVLAWHYLLSTFRHLALFIGKHVFAYKFVISFYKHLRAHTNFLEKYIK